jgi:tetratricopeptide (TPR) repeat protein
VAAAKKDILQGWKDIAAYVSRDVRTVKRWEKQRGLPVRRMPGDGRANVYALIPELDNWLSNGVPAEVEQDLDTDPVLDLDDSQVSETSVGEPVYLEREIVQPAPTHRRRWIYAAVAIVCLGAVAAVALGLRARHHEITTDDVPPFSPTQTVQFVKSNSKVPGVDALYLRGIYFYEQRTPDTLDRALKCFQEAIEKDPTYAPAYGGLAQTYNLIREYSMMPEAEAYTKAQAAAEHAIAIDPKLPEAHASLGFIKFFWDLDPSAAEHEFHTAIALDPNSALAHHWYGSMLTHQGRFTESLAQLDLAQRLQPTSTSILCDRAYALGLSGQRNEAADILQEIINEDPSSPSPHYIRAIISLVEPRDLARFLDERRRFAVLRHDPQGLHQLDELDAAFRAGGSSALWTAMLAQEVRNHPNARTYSMATAEALLGRTDDSLRDLALLAQRRDPNIVGVVVDPLLTSLKKDPRYTAITAIIVGPRKS